MEKDIRATLDDFTRAYIECALWSSSDVVDGEDVNLDDNHSLEDIAAETLASMIADCASFQLDNAGLLRSTYAHETSAGCGRLNQPYGASQAGHDFWLTRCGHGAGFWDRGLGTIGERLSEKASMLGNIDLYINSDGRIYA